MKTLNTYDVKEKVTRALVDIEIMRALDLEANKDLGTVRNSGSMGETVSIELIKHARATNTKLVAYAQKEAQNGVNYRNSLKG